MGVIGWTRMGLVGSTNWLENLLFIFNRHSYEISTHEDKHYSNHTVFIRTSNCTANTCTTSTTVCHHTHLGLKVDNRFESGKDLNNVWMTMEDSYHQSSNISLEEKEIWIPFRWLSLNKPLPVWQWHKVTMYDGRGSYWCSQLWQHEGMTGVSPQVVQSSSDGTCGV